MTETGEFNEGALDMLRRVGNGKLLASMIHLFCTNAPERMKQIHHSVSQGNTNGVMLAAHSLRSSAGQIGAVRLQQVCSEIEQAAGEQDVARMQMLAYDADQVFARALAWVRLNAGEREAT